MRQRFVAAPALLVAICFTPPMPAAPAPPIPEDLSLLRQVEPAGNGQVRYIDHLVGFSFELPSGWLDSAKGYTESRTYQQFSVPKGSGAYVRRIDRLRSSHIGTLDKAVAQAIKDEHNKAVKKDDRRIEHAGVKGVQLDFELPFVSRTHRSRHLFFECPEFIYHIRLSGPSNAPASEGGFEAVMEPAADRILASLERIAHDPAPAMTASTGYALFRSYHADIKLEVPEHWLGRDKLEGVGMYSGLNFGTDNVSLRFDSRARNRPETRDLEAYVAHLRGNYGSQRFEVVGERRMILNGIKAAVLNVRCPGAKEFKRRVVVLETERNVVMLDFYGPAGKGGRDFAKKIAPYADHMMWTVASMTKAKWGGGLTRGFDPETVDVGNLGVEPKGDKADKLGKGITPPTPARTETMVVPRQQQEVRLGDEVGVVIPKGALRRSAKITIAKRDSPPRLLPGILEVAAAWTIESSEAFAEPITLELALPNGGPPTASPWLWLEDAKRWVPVPFEPHPSRPSVLVRTKHLSDWALVVGLKGMVNERVTIHKTRFDILYRQEDLVLKDKVAKKIEKALEVYESWGYAVPGSWMRHVVIIDDYKDPSYNALAGVMYIPRKHASETEFTQDVAHEVFHIVENQYFNHYRMAYLRWWMEVAAELAANEYVLRGYRGPSPGWMDESFMFVNDSHEYETAAFFDWALRRTGLKFDDAWAATASEGSLDQVMRVVDESPEVVLQNAEKAHELTIGAIETLIVKKLLADGKQPDEHNQLWGMYRDFVADNYFSQKAPHPWPLVGVWGTHQMKTYASYDRAYPYTPQRVKQVTLPASYSAHMWAVKPEVSSKVATRRIRFVVDGSIPEGVEVCIYELPGNAPQKASLPPHQIMRAGEVNSQVYEIEAVKNAQGQLQPDKHLYVLMTNPTAKEASLSIFAREEPGAANLSSVRHDLPRFGFSVNAPGTYGKSAGTEQPGRLELENLAVPDWQRLVVEHLPESGGGSGAEAILLEKLEEKYGRLHKKSDESKKVGGFDGRWLEYSGTWKRRVEKKTYSFEGSSRSIVNPGEWMELPVVVRAWIFDDGADGYAAWAIAAPFELGKLSGAVASLSPLEFDGESVLHDIAGSGFTVMTPAAWGVTARDGATTFSHEDHLFIEAVVLAPDSTAGDMEGALEERAGARRIRLEKLVETGNRRFGGMNAKYVIHHGKGADGLPIEAQALFVAGEKTRLLLWGAGGPGYRQALAKRLLGAQPGVTHEFEILGSTYNLTTPPTFAKVTGSDQALVLAQSKEAGVHVVETPCATEAQMVQFIEASWDKRVPGFRRTSSKRCSLLGTNALCNDYAHDSASGVQGIWTVFFVRRNTRFIMFSLGNHKSEAQLRGILESLDGPRGDELDLAGVWRGQMIMENESEPTQIELKIVGGNVNFNEAGAVREQGPIQVRDFPFEAAGDLQEGFRIVSSVPGGRVEVESSEVCVDLRGGKDASLMNGKSMLRKDAVVSYGQWQLERISRPR